MFDDVNLYAPDFYVDCSTINDPGKVYKIFRDKGIKKAYVYAIAYRKTPFEFDFFKVGLSNPTLDKKRKHQVGERVVRQLSWLPGWRKSVTSSNGYDLWNGIQKLIDQGIIDKKFDKNLVTVGVWDITKRLPNLKVFITNENQPVQWAEGELSQQYERTFGWRPRLNEVNPATTAAHKQGYLSKEIWANNFAEIS